MANRDIVALIMAFCVLSVFIGTAALSFAGIETVRSKDYLETVENILFTIIGLLAGYMGVNNDKGTK